jgi:hypothetical protein
MFAVVLAALQVLVYRFRCMLLLTAWMHNISLDVILFLPTCNGETVMGTEKRGKVAGATGREGGSTPRMMTLIPPYQASDESSDNNSRKREKGNSRGSDGQALESKRYRLKLGFCIA